ncbi:MAG: HAD family hydrolase [Candidatus Freyarchaeota archaeon]|nr:HAD family hydrolase [Candidatus Jordarchaeia archaeon]
MIEGIIFDMDGVLVALNVSVEEMLKRAEEKAGLKPGPSGFRGLLEHAMRDRGVYRALMEVIDELEVSAVEERMTVFPETKRVVAYLGERYPLALVTLQGRRAAEMVLEKLGIRRFFKFIFTREDSFFRREQVEKAVQALGIDKERVLVVGDRRSDKVAAEEVGCKVVIVRRGQPTIERGEFISSLDELPRLIEQIQVQRGRSHRNA